MRSSASPRGDSSNSSAPSKATEGSSWSARDRELISLGRTNLPEAISFIEAHYDATQRRNATEFLLRELAKERLEIISELPRLIEDRSGRLFVLDVAAQEWVKKDAQAAVKFSESLADQTLGNELQKKVIKYLSEAGRLNEAADTINGMPPSSARNAAMGYFGVAFARKNPEAAVQWAATFTQKGEAESAQNSVFSGLREKPDLRNFEDFYKIARPNMRGQVALEIGRLAGTEGVHAVQALLNQYPTESGQIAQAAMETLPDHERLLLLESTVQSGSPGLRNVVVSSYVEALFASDRGQAVAWVTNAAPADQADATSALISRWYEVDTNALMAWVQALPAGERRDVALGDLVFRLKKFNPVAARRMAAQITNPAQRSQAEAPLR